MSASMVDFVNAYGLQIQSSQRRREKSVSSMCASGAIFRTTTPQIGGPQILTSPTNYAQNTSHQQLFTKNQGRGGDMSVSQIMMTSADVSNYDLGTRTTTSLATRRIPLQKDQNSSSFSKAKLSKRSLKSRQE